ncbi:hypothetical protein KDN24_03830 [Bacillus sp. Bva_UNVM-123]|uniref:hypothetical protein n=1 Tax=Bacillus sp. Bva_UNVM-123 TaxID=2829798 RepID=UPI00391F9DA4
MNKDRIPHLFVMILFILLAACSTERIEKVTISKMKNYSEIVEDSSVEITDSEVISMLKNAVNGAVKRPGIVDMANPQYKVEIGQEAYFLWISTDSGTIMNVKDTHTIFSFSNKAIKQVNELIASKFSE